MILPRKLRFLLDQFVTMAKAVSFGVGYPAINRATPVYNAVIDTLKEFIEQESDLSLQHAAIHEIKTFGILLESGFHISICSGNRNPRILFNWWGANDWNENVQISKDIVTKIWNQHYKGKEGPIDLNAEIARQMKLYGIKKNAPRA